MLVLHRVHFNKTSSNRLQTKSGQNIFEIYPQASPLTPPAATSPITSSGFTIRSVHLTAGSCNSMIRMKGAPVNGIMSLINPVISEIGGENPFQSAQSTEDLIDVSDPTVYPDPTELAEIVQIPANLLKGDFFSYC
jgi:hypothetical protein